MPTLATVLRTEIRRAAAREGRRAGKQLRRLQKQVRALRLTTQKRDKTIASLERRVKRLRTRAAKAIRGAMAAVRGRARGPHFSGDAVRALRARFQMTRLQFAKLLKVSPGSIFGWETGRTLPRGKNLERMAEVRKLGARGAKARVGAPARKLKKAPRRGRRRRS
jgi:DNA-binding XRE family transcriptional regulator